MVCPNVKPIYRTLSSLGYFSLLFPKVYGYANGGIRQEMPKKDRSEA